MSTTAAKKKTTKKMAEEDAQTQSMFNIDYARLITTEHGYISPSEEGVFTIEPIVCGLNTLAVATFQPARSSHIHVTGNEEVSDVGIIVGLPVDVVDGKIEDFAFQLGDIVKFSPRHKLCDIKGHFAKYDDAEVLCIRPDGVFCVLGKAPIALTASE